MSHTNDNISKTVTWPLVVAYGIVYMASNNKKNFCACVIIMPKKHDDDDDEPVGLYSLVANTD